ncbi:hypothetical protein GF412_03465 [Candidatus Micrarchaeota archaeon]|nr:hypothetical protein [Candidatus Micrarchaeota archaeon]
MLVSLSSTAGFTSEDLSNKITFLDVSAADGTVTAKLTYLTVEGDISHDLPDLTDAFREAEKGNQEAAEQILEESGLTEFEDLVGNLESETKPLPGAYLSFRYMKQVEDDTGAFVYVEEEILGCEEVETDEEGIAECPLYEEVYSGTCSDVFVTFGDSVFGTQVDDEVYPYVEERILVCDKNTTALGVMRNQIKGALSENDNPLCFISMLLGGLLLASMFFAGRSPISLLDITTPLLPKAKSISYSGLRMGTGFGRIMGEMGAMGGEAGGIAAASKATSQRLLRYLRKKGGYNKHLVNLIMNSGASETIKMMALRAVIAGKGRRYIQGMLSMKGKSLLDPELQKAYAQYLRDIEQSPDAEELNKKKSSHDAVVLLSQMNMLNAMQQKSFVDSTGEIPAWFKSPLGKTLGKLPFIGTHIMGGTASLFYGARHVKRFYSSSAKAAVRTAGNLVLPKEKGAKKGRFTNFVNQAVRDARRKGEKPNPLYNWLSTDISEAGNVQVFNNFEYGAALYKRMMTEARRDVVNWLLGTIIAKYGGKMDFSKKELLEVGFKTPEELMFKGFKPKQFAKIEAELRKILSNKGLGDLEKAKQIMALMDSAGIAYDKAGVSNAIRMLEEIDSEMPSSAAGPGILDEDNDDAIDCQKLIRLQEYLKDQFSVDEPIGLKESFNAFEPDGKFFFTVGRTTVSEGKADFTLGTLFRSKYREALESPTRSGQGPLSIREVANYAFLRVVNERWGIMDPDTPGLDKRLVQVMKNAELWLRSLADPSLKKAPFSDLIGALYAPSARPTKKQGVVGMEEDLMGVMGHGPEYGPIPGKWRMDMKGYWRVLGGPTGGAQTSVQNEAFGEIHRAHNVPVAVQQLIEQSGGKLSYKAAADHYMNDVVVPSYLLRRLRGIVEQDNPNTYFTSQVEYDRFKNIMASYRAFIARSEEKEKGLARGKIDPTKITDKQVLEFMGRKHSLEEISESEWIRLREGSYAPFIQEHIYRTAQGDRVVNAAFYIRRGGYWEEFAPEKFLKQKPLREVLYGALGKDNAIRKMLGDVDYLLGEGEIRGVPNKLISNYKNMLDNFARVREGKATLKYGPNDINSLFSELSSLAKKDPKKAEACAAMAGYLIHGSSPLFLPQYAGSQLSKLDLTRFGKFGEDVKMELMLKDFQGAVDKDQKERAAKSLMDWAKEGSPGEERHVKVALLLYNSAQKTGDWTHFNSFDAVKMMPRATADLKVDQVQNYEKLTGLKGWVKNAVNSGRNVWDPILKNANLGLEHFMLNTFGKQMKAEYEGSLVSGYFREVGGKFASKLAAGEFGNPDMRVNQDPAMREYNRLMDSFTRYHAIWDETITRDPRGNSSAVGSGFIFSAFFHHGPAMAFGPGLYRRWTYAGYQQPWTTWKGFKANVRERMWGLQWAPQAFNWAIGTPLGVGYRTYVTSRWGYMSKYDRQYQQPPKQVMEDYAQKVSTYNARYDNLVSQYKSDYGLSATAARNEAEKRLKAMGVDRPEPPAFELERNILNPYSFTPSRKSEAAAAMLNWFYASFDPTATNWKRFAAIAGGSPIAPFASFVPNRWIQSKILGNGSTPMNRSDTNPYYVSPGAVRSQLTKMAGPMVKRGYGGSEIISGVTRSHEDTWGYQAGVNSIWGNTNPGATYLDFSHNVKMDPRAANYLRYESRFRPYFEYDDYVRKQANLGLVKRDINPFNLMNERNSELRHYKFPENTLFRFLNPATFAAYKGAAYMGRFSRTVLGARDMFREATTNVSTNRGGRMANIGQGIGNVGIRGAERLGNFLHRKAELGFRKSIRYCQACGSPMVEGGVCHACARKTRCPYCHETVNPGQNHTCTHGIQRNLLNEDLSGTGLRGTSVGGPKGVLRERKENWVYLRKRAWGTLWGREP